MTECQFDNCNRPNGHPGPHGITVDKSGIVFAPHGGDEGTLGQREFTNLPCDNCGGGMNVQRFGHGGGVFKCGLCEQCVTYMSDGSSSATIIPALYPSKMSESSKLFQELLDHRMSEVRFHCRARHILGLITSDERDDQISAFDDQVAAKRREIAATKKRSWWRIW